MKESGAQNKLRTLYLISFIEGGVVMVTEISGAKILTPYFGASLYSWASTLSITLFALMSGYYYGGYLTTKSKFSSASNIIWIFFLSGLSVLALPTLSSFVLEKTVSFNYFTGLILSEFSFLFLPIFLMGMISPMIIYQITKKAELSGRSAGNIYAISTSGGILFTLCFGFLFIPNYGISLPLRVLGLCVSVVGLLLILKNKLSAEKIPLALLLFTINIILAFNNTKPKDFLPQSNKKLVAYSEGLLGELKVMDELVYNPKGGTVNIRKLRTNNIQQNYVFTDMPSQSLMYYVNFTKQLVNFFPKKKSALLIGLGAGSLYSVLQDQHINVESVEIDKRIYDMGVKYFGLPKHENHTITDGRYFINVVKKKYDLIVLDVIIGESVPAQLITKESFQRCYKILSDSGTLLIEHGGLNHLEKNTFIPCIYKTLEAAGFQVRIFNPLLSKNHGDVMFVATKTKFKTDSIHLKEDVFVKGGSLNDFSLSIDVFDNSEANVLTDDKNNIDLLLRSHYYEVRKNIRKELTKYRSMTRS